MLNEAKSAEGRIPPETRERVLKAIRDTGYVADPIARSMVKGANRILGVFTYQPAFPIVQADFYTPFLMGIEEEAERLSYDLLLMTAAARDDNGRKRIFGETGRLRLADGCLILGSQFDRDELAQLVAGDYPYVAVGRRDDAGGPVRYVGADYVTATHALVREALAAGHRRFAFIGATGPAESISDRWRGFLAAIEGAAELVYSHESENGDPAEQLAAVRASGASVVFCRGGRSGGLRQSCPCPGVSVPADLSIVVLGSGTARIRFGYSASSPPMPSLAKKWVGRRLPCWSRPSPAPRPRKADIAGLRHRGGRNARLPKTWPNSRKENLT